MSADTRERPASNVDPAELAKFSALAHRWWDPESEFSPLHEINPLRLAYIERLVGGLAGKRVLDVGCGGGILAEAMAARGAKVTGIDLADKSLKVAQLHLLESGVEVDYRLGRAEEPARPSRGAFDVVTCMEMLEHVPDPASTVRACAHAREARRLGLLLHHQPQPQVLPLRDRRRRVRAAPAAARHARVREVHHALGARRATAAPRGSTPADITGLDLQPVHQGLSRSGTTRT